MAPPPPRAGDIALKEGAGRGRRVARNGIGQIAGRAASCASSSAPPPSPVGRGRRRRMSLPATGTQTRALESRALQRRKAHRHGSSKVALALQRVLCGILDGYGAGIRQDPVRVCSAPPVPLPAGRRHAAALERRRGDRAQRRNAVHGRARAVQGRPRHGCRIEKNGDHSQRTEPRHGGGRGRNLRPCRSRPVYTRRAARDAAAAAAPGRGKGRRRTTAAGYGRAGAAGTAAFLPPAGAGATG